MIEVPRQYEEGIKEIIKILDAYVPNFDLDDTWRIIRMATILDAENFKGFTLKLLMNKYYELHNIGREL